ncbi:tfiih basal transcription factor complex p47 subunit [Colletotrichum truncatum]|uniref:Tfiih basal transcription factor complex p47 subunit n=1 Tax=Colletotrichum truncatum TaxID=5467 RepID=A0ACC3Z9P5_COLTU|nr:tfiih basal transcription factor complex p47 subunit [Colletotrichum truncatum]KAF6793683.1 tfiih basal transcription factor complex p47 subunit [Colletotrichum truncatum]
MADSDGEYVEDMSDDELLDHQAAGDNGPDGKSGKARGNGKKGKSGHSKARWEDVKRSWEEVTEGADGSLAVGASLEAEKRRRLLRDTTPLQRGIIRHLVLVLDMSFAMTEKDMLPNRYRVAWAYAADFVKDYFEQNPISQLGIIGMRDGVAVRISDMSGNPTDHLEKLRSFEGQDPSGNPSLQNALEMCRGALFHAPSHGTREVLVVFGALLSSDPGDIHDTISSLITDRIRVSVVGLAAQVAICAELCTRTNVGDDAQYSVCMNDAHFRDLLLAATTPPVTRTAAQSTASLLMMGFPSRTLAQGETTALCACHNKPVREGYLCTRCRTRVCRLPIECPACSLTLILSTHLARSYHHLFPLRNWVEVPWADAAKSKACYSCLTAFPEPPKAVKKKEKDKEKDRNGVSTTPAVAPTPVAPSELKGVSESGRYACTVCNNHFCIDCDVYAHEVIHNCPGCQSDIRGAGMEVVVETNGAHEHQTNGTAMVVDS